MKNICKIKSFICFSIKILIIFQLISFSHSQQINKIIQLGESGLRYSHFSFNSHGDMIVDTTSFPVNNKRHFFGLRRNGKSYFKNTDNSESSYYTMILDNSKGRIEGESFFIKLSSTDSNVHGKELICGISKRGQEERGYYVEIYNLEDKNYTQYITLEMFGKITSESFVITKAPDESDSNYYYLVSYIAESSSKYYNYIRKIYFSFENSQGYVLSKEFVEEEGQHRLISGFYTEKSIYICTYLSAHTVIRVKAFNDSNFNQVEKSLVYKPSSFGEKIFFKGIHLKGEIGFFIYFKTKNIQYLSFSILQCNNELQMETYLNYVEIDINDRTFNSDWLLNDIVKLNNFQICYISIDPDKKIFQLVIFTLYKNDILMNMRYYDIDMWNSHRMRIYLCLKASLYKNFISLAFSHCPKEVPCTSASDEPHYSSLIIFNYPNSTDINLDLVQQLISTNKKIENDFSFNFEGTLEIENNIFGLVFKGTRIMKIPSGVFLTNTTNNEILENESLILKDENVSLYFENPEKYVQKDYIIEYA